MNSLFYKELKMLFKGALLITVASTAYAAQDSLIQKQESLLQKLTDIKESAVGFSIEGIAKSGFHNSSISSDSLSTGSPSAETNAFTEMNLVFQAKPSVESGMRVEFRIHQDWQKAHEQGLNPLLVHWWSYDGVTLDKQMKFNIGDMRVGYTPLTIYQTNPEVLYEPEIFKARRQEAMAYRDLDGSNRRLLQGLNADYHSGKVSVLDDIHAQADVARLRTMAKKIDQIYFDFDRSDRYLFGGRLGVTAYGVNLGVNEAYAFDRLKSSRNFKSAIGDTLVYEDNGVTSFELGYDSKYSLSEQPFFVKLNAEYSSSNWKLMYDIGKAEIPTSVALRQDVFLTPDGMKDTTMYVVRQNIGDTTVKMDLETISNEKGNALLVNLDGGYDLEAIQIRAKLNYVSANEKYWSELASTPSYLGFTPILNSDAQFSSTTLGAALDLVRSGSLENMYFSTYESRVQNQRNIVGTTKNLDGGAPQEISYYHLSNNYRMAHYYRNGYTFKTFKKMEYAERFALDPAIGLALPFGYATPDRKGFDLNLSTMYNNAISGTVLFGSYSAPEMDATYQTIGAGAEVKMGRFLNLGRIIDVNGSFEQTTESKGLKRKSSRIVVGTNVGVWDNISLLAGFQTLQKDMNTLNILNTKESLLLVGPQIELSKGSLFSLQYGLMSNEIEYLSVVDGSKSKLGIDKSLISADVSVKF